MAENNNNTKNRVGLMKQATEKVAKPDTAAAAAAFAAGSEAAKVTAANDKNEKEVAVTNLRQTLDESNLRQHFRQFLRTKLDMNKSGDPDQKKTFEQWLDYVTACEEVYGLPETDTKAKADLMIKIGEKFLGKPPESHNIALRNQLNRKELQNHCTNLSEKVPGLSADVSLLKDGYEYIFSKLDQKHVIFKKTFKPPTTTLALLCSLL